MLSIWNNSVDFPKFNSLNCDKTAENGKILDDPANNNVD